MADRVLEFSRDALLQWAALRVLAELTFDEGDVAAARALALRSVGLAVATIGEHPNLAPELLTLARTQEPAEARATLERALALPLPPRHPVRAKVIAAAAAHGLVPAD